MHVRWIRWVTIGVGFIFLLWTKSLKHIKPWCAILSPFVREIFYAWILLAANISDYSFRACMASWPVQHGCFLLNELLRANSGLNESLVYRKPWRWLLVFGFQELKTNKAYGVLFSDYYDACRFGLFLVLAIQIPLWIDRPLTRRQWWALTMTGLSLRLQW